MFGTFSINSDSDKFTLEANYDFENSEFYMPSLSFNHIKDTSGYSITWDHVPFLYGSFLPFLKRSLEGKSNIKDVLDFAPVINTLDKDSTKELVEILEKGIELGWDKL
jgi:hypothetical protein